LTYAFENLYNIHFYKSVFFEIDLIGNIRLYLKIKPNSPFLKFGEVVQNRLVVYLKAASENGNANKELISFLSKEFKLPKNNIIIERGLNIKLKTILLNSQDEAILKYLEGL
jgi:uncharacterized protein YggU (UPF0235/DUF167 family)